MNIVRLSPGHAPRYRALMLRAYALEPIAFTTSAGERETTPLRWWENRLMPGEESASVVVGAFLSDELIAVAGIAFEQSVRTRHKSRLFGMYIDPLQRKSGLSKALLNAIVHQAHSRPGITCINLTVTEENKAAVRCYEQAGFQLFGREPDAIVVDGVGYTKLHMRYSLEKEV